HRKPQQLPPAMDGNKKCEELLKGNRRNHKQINRRNPLHMIAKEGLPGLQWPILRRHHVDRNRVLVAQDKHMVDALASNRSDQSFDEAVLPRRGRAVGLSRMSMARSRYMTQAP